jgi:beta-mannosidase
LWLEEKSLNMPANGKALVGLEELKTAAADYDAADLWIRVQLSDSEGVAYDQTAYLVPARDLHLPVPKVKVSTEANGAQLSVTLQSSVLVMGLYLSLEGLPGNFSDNFFDLCPGEPKTVELTLPEPPEQGWPPVRLLSVYDSYTE